MNKFKVGDKVLYLNHTHDMDKYYFKIGEIYTIKEVKLSACMVEESNLVVFNKQIRLVKQINSINKLLYPDYIEENGYLVLKEKYENS